MCIVKNFDFCATFLHTFCFLFFLVKFFDKNLNNSLQVNKNIQK